MRKVDPELQSRRREQILAAAAVCFVRRGFHQSSMQDICAEAQMSPGALYHYFDSKESIIKAIADEYHIQTMAFLEKLRDSENFVEGFIAAVTQALEISIKEEHPRLAVEILAEASRNPKIARLFDKTELETKKTLVRLLQDAARRGEIDATLKAEHTAEILLALIEGIEGRAILNPSIKVCSLAPTLATLIARFLQPAKAGSR